MQAVPFRRLPAAAVALSILAVAAVSAAPLPALAAAEKPAQAACAPQANRVVVIGKRMSAAERRAYDAGVADGRRLAQAEAQGADDSGPADRAAPDADGARSSVEPGAAQRLASRSRASGAGKRLF